MAAAHPDFAIENALGLPAIAGVDEVGRGALAGPVVAVAVLLDRDRLDPDLAGRIRDSKLLRADERRAIARRLAAAALAGAALSGEGRADRDEIDRLNILEATMLAMRRAVDALSARAGRAPDTVLVDGPRCPALDCPARAVVRGDSRSITIAAASILAKVARDAHMAALAAAHPGYGWERNAGYGTAEHRSALERLGPTTEHRNSFAPVRRVLEGRA